MKKNTLIIILIILIMILFFFVLKDNNIDENYIINIEQPKNIENKNIEKKVKDYIKLQIKKVKNKKDKSELIITSNKFDYGDVHVLIINTKIKPEEIEIIKVYKYDKYKEINISSYFIENSNYLDIIKIYIKEYLEKNNIKEIIKKEQIDNSYFNNEGLNIILNINNKAHKVIIPYEKIKDKLSYNHIDNHTKEKINRNIENYKNEKIIAITFDDGPSKYTNKLLTELDKRNIKVTFFVVGNRVSRYKEEVKREYELKHQICSHTYSHKRLTELEGNELKSEINKTNEEIKKITNKDTNCLRPPYGSVNKEVLEKTNMINILWNLDTLDWKYRDKKRVKEQILKNVKDGSIILLHDLYETSIDGVLEAIDELKEYKFVTINEMAQIKNIKLKKGKKYSYIK